VIYLVSYTTINTTHTTIGDVPPSSLLDPRRSNYVKEWK
jgi:hypothetical protein